jgi:hypothetical protein
MRASSSAWARSVSLATCPRSVTTPFAVATSMVRPFTAVSRKYFAWIRLLIMSSVSGAAGPPAGWADTSAASAPVVATGAVSKPRADGCPISS